jgi:hypothetical protein
MLSYCLNQPLRWLHVLDLQRSQIALCTDSSIRHSSEAALPGLI